MINIGYIGMGIMGGAMARNFLTQGYPVAVYNRTATKCEPLAAAGAVVCSSPAAVAERSDVVFVNVTDTPDVREVIFEEGGIVHSNRQGLIIIDNSTISPEATREYSRQVESRAMEYLDAPVSGGDIGAQKGTLAIMVGGKKEIFEKCLPLFEVIGSRISYVGPAGMGQVCKACNQLIGSLHLLACCEGIALAKKAGLDPRDMIEVVSAGASGSWVLENLAGKIINGDYAPGFMIDLLRKDIRIVMEMASDYELPLMGGSLAEQLFCEAQEQGLGCQGTQALFKVIEDLGR